MKVNEVLDPENYYVSDENGNNTWNMFSYIETQFAEDCSDFAEGAKIKSGFRNLDEVTSLYPGLYVVGAVSSLGKTTFVLQLCDQIARAGTPVLFYSLEQSVTELASKSLSRTMSELFPEIRWMSSLQIRKNFEDERVTAAVEEYQKFSENIDIMTPDDEGFGLSIKDIEGRTEAYIKHHQKVPVVIVDYLQIIRPENTKADKKTQTDECIQRLKMLQRRYGMILIVISSLNRQNYEEPIAFESFKESGGIEYTADVLYGLQLDVFDNSVFQDSRSTTAKKRQVINKAKIANPRKVQLVCLKNRYGKSGYVCNFDYYTNIDKFVPVKGDPDDAFYFMDATDETDFDYCAGSDPFSSFA